MTLKYLLSCQITESCSWDRLADHLLHRLMLTDELVIWEESPKKPAGGYELPRQRARGGPEETRSCWSSALLGEKGWAPLLGTKGRKDKSPEWGIYMGKYTGKCRLMLVGQQIISPHVLAVLELWKSSGTSLTGALWNHSPLTLPKSAVTNCWLGSAGACFLLFSEWYCKFCLKYVWFQPETVFPRRLLGRRARMFAD